MLHKAKLVVVEPGGGARSKVDSATRRINSNKTSENDSPFTTTAKGADIQYFGEMVVMQVQI